MDGPTTLSKPAVSHEECFTLSPNALSLAARAAARPGCWDVPQHLTQQCGTGFKSAHACWCKASGPVRPGGTSVSSVEVWHCEEAQHHRSRQGWRARTHRISFSTGCCGLQCHLGSVCSSCHTPQGHGQPLNEQRLP